MIRKIDDLGRIVIPAEMRKELGFKNGDDVNIRCKNNKIVILNPNKDDQIEKVINILKGIEAPAEELAIIYDVLRLLNKLKGE